MLDYFCSSSVGSCHCCAFGTIGAAVLLRIAAGGRLAWRAATAADVAASPNLLVLSG